MKNATGKTGKHRTQNQAGRENIPYNMHKHRPEIRDDMDSREGEEQLYKGDDTTHNRKSHRSLKHTTKE